MRLSELTPADEILDDPAELARRYRATGCLFVRGLLRRSTAADLADQAAAVLRGWGVARPGRAGAEVRWTGRPVGLRDFTDVDAVPALEGLVAGFATRPPRSLAESVDRACGGPMSLWRNACFFTGIPDDPAYVTKPHQDGYALSATGDYRRVWIAVTAIPFGDGGLGVALGSHRSGRLPERDFPELRARPAAQAAVAKPVRGVDPALVDDHWHTAEFQPGDALIFHTDLVHRGLPATSDRIRLALAVIASAAGDPRPPVTFTKQEMRARRARLTELGGPLGLPATQLDRIAVDLAMSGQPVTQATVLAAMAGDHAGWRRAAPAQLARHTQPPHRAGPA